MPGDWNVIEPVIEAPAPDSPSFLAHKLLVSKDPTQRLVLQAVVSGPKRFKELKEATGQPDGQINRALDILHDEGVLVERLHARSAPVYKTHELGTKGILVVTMMTAFQEAETAVKVKSVPRARAIPGAKPAYSLAYVFTRGGRKTSTLASRAVQRKKTARSSARFKLAKRKTAGKEVVRSSRSKAHLKV